MIAFLLGAIFLVPVGAVFGELTAAIPISGGIVEYVDRSFGRTLSYITGWLLALGNGILCPWEAIAISTLVSEMFGSLPGLEWLRAIKLYTILGADVYLFPTLIALGFAVYVIFLNFRGASSAAKLQAFLTKALLCGMLLAMGVSLFTGSPNNAMPVFSQVAGAGGGKAATEGTSLFAGIVSVLVLTPFFYAGFDTIPQQAEEAAEGLNWNKFGKIISLALLAAGGTLGPMGPMNSFYGATSRIMLAMGRKGQLPEKFAEVDPNSGAPKLACVVLAIITVVGPFLGKNMLIPLTNVSALAFIFSCGMVALACLRMRFTEPDLPRPYEVPGGKFGISLAIAACAIIIGLLVIPFSPASLNMVEWSIVIGWLAIGLALMAFTNSRKK